MKRKRRKPAQPFSRRSLRIIVTAVAVMVTAVIFLDRTYRPLENRTPAPAATRQTPADIIKYNSRTFCVVKTVDGDTIDIDIPDKDKPHTRIRLWGVDTPETSKSPTGAMYFGEQASEFTRSLTLNKQVTIFLDERYGTRGKYGRLLAYVQLPDKTFLNERLLSEGFAYADLRFQHSLFNKYKQLESAARSNRKGLWQNATREDLPNWLRNENPKLLTEK